MNKFKRFYIWTVNAKLYSSIYFVAILSLIALIEFLQGKLSVDILVMIEATIPAVITGILQCIMVDDVKEYSKSEIFKRRCLWTLISSISTGASSYLFRWFERDLILYSIIIFLFMILGCILMIIGIDYELEMGTVKLNDDLKSYKERLNKEDDKNGSN